MRQQDDSSVICCSFTLRQCWLKRFVFLIEMFGVEMRKLGVESLLLVGKLVSLRQGHKSVITKNLFSFMSDEGLFSHGK